jgi:hypothetical protein
MSRVSAWLQDKPPVDVTMMTEEELLYYWAANRNGMGAVMAADESMKRKWRRVNGDNNEAEGVGRDDRGEGPR